MNFSRSLTSLGAANTLRSLAGILKNKLAAVWLGVEGMGYFAQGQLLVSSLYNVATFGLGMAIIKYYSGDDFKENPARRQLLSTALFLMLILSLTLVIPGLVFIKPLTRILFGDTQYACVLLMIMVFIPVFNMFRFFEAVTNAELDFFQLAAGNGTSTIVATLLYIPGLYFFGITGGILGILLMYLVGIIYFGGVLRRKYGIKLIHYLHPSNLRLPIATLLVRFGGSQVIRNLVVYLSLLTIRSLIIARLGPEQNGIFQAAWGLAAYFTIITGTFSAIVIPTISSLEKQESQVQRELQKIYSQILIFFTPLVLITLLFGNFLINMFYSAEFRIAADLLAVFMLAKLFEVSNIFFASIYLGRSRLIPFMLIDMGRFLLFLVGTLLLPSLVLADIAWVYLFSQVSIFLLVLSGNIINPGALRITGPTVWRMLRTFGPIVGIWFITYYQDNLSISVKILLMILAVVVVGFRDLKQVARDIFKT